MNRRTHRFGIRSLLRSAGIFLLVSMLAFQFMPAPASAMSDADHVHAPAMHMHAVDCHDAADMRTDLATVTDEHTGAHESGAHCAPSMCCFHAPLMSARLAMVGMLLPSDRLIERGTAPASVFGSTQDRPPRLV